MSGTFEVGKFYRVPTVAAAVGNGFKNIVRIWPIIGAWHEDAELIGFKDHHYHLDARFVSDDALRLLGENEISIFRIAITQEDFVDGNAVVMRRRKCRRNMPRYPREKPTWLWRLSNAYAGRRLGPKMICPHKGADLSSMPKVNGCIVCPLHGLAFKNGVCVRKIQEPSHA